MKSGIIAIVLGLTMMLASITSAQTVPAVPRFINFQGFLTGVPGGTPINATVDLTFNIYTNATGTGTPLWTEFHPNVEVRRGACDLLLGESNALDLANFDFTGGALERWLEVWVGGDRVMPLLAIASLPYAYRASDAATLGGFSNSVFMKKTVDDFTVGLLTISNNLVVKTNLQVMGTAEVANISVLTNQIWVSGTNIISQWTHTNLVTNLNAEMLDGYHAADFIKKREDDFTVGLLTISNNLVVKTNLQVMGTAEVANISVLTNQLWVSGTNIISKWTHTNLVTNLNADMVDGYHASAFLLRSGGTMIGNITMNDNTRIWGTNVINSLVIIDNTITADDIASDAVGASEIAADAVGASEIAADAVGVSEISADAVGASEIAANAVGASEIAADAVGASEISADAVGASEIAAGAVGASEIAANAVGSDEIGTGAVGSDEIAANAVTTVKLADNAVTSAKIADGTIANADIAANANIAASKIDEDDPEVGANTPNYVPRWNGSALALVSGTIVDNGNVGIGITPHFAAKLDVNGHAAIRGGLAVGWSPPPDFNAEEIERNYRGIRLGVVGNVYIFGQVYVNGVYVHSDDRLKFNEQKLEYGLTQVMALEPKRYDQAEWEYDPETEDIVIHPEITTNHIGLVAQDVQKVIPEAVSIPENENARVWSLSYDTIIPVLVKAIQEQQAQIEELKNEIQAMKSGI